MLVDGLSGRRWSGLVAAVAVAAVALTGVGLVDAPPAVASPAGQAEPAGVSRDVPLLESSAVPEGVLAGLPAEDPGMVPQRRADRVSGFDPETSREVGRDEFSVTYENADGTSTVRSSTAPVSVRDGSDGWTAIDTTVAPPPPPPAPAQTAAAAAEGEGERLGVTAHPLSPSFASAADEADLLRVEVDGGASAAVSVPDAAAAPVRELPAGRPCVFRTGNLWAHFRTLATLGR